MFKFFGFSTQPDELLTSTLYDETTFYEKFARDLKKCQHEAIIESPFVTSRRLSSLLPILQKLKSQNVRITISTRDPEEHDDEHMRDSARRAISRLQHM